MDDKRINAALDTLYGLVTMDNKIDSTDLKIVEMAFDALLHILEEMHKKQDRGESIRELKLLKIKVLHILQAHQ